MRKSNYGDFSAVVLAGGKSTRMGFPKSRLMVGSKNIVQAAVEILRQIFPEVLIVGNKLEGICEEQGIKKVEDIIKNCGPMGGILTGLKVISREVGFFVACDMPHIRQDLIRRLVDTATDCRFDCLVPSHGGGLEPLHALYSKKILPEMEKAIRENRLSLVNLLKKCNCKYLPVKEEEAISFTNINTPFDLEKLKTGNLR